MWVRGAGAGPLAWLLPQTDAAELRRAPAGGRPDSGSGPGSGWGGAAHLPGSALPVRSWEKLAACAPRSPGSPKQPADLARLLPAAGRAGAEGSPPGAEPHPGSWPGAPAPLCWVRWRPRSALAAEALPECAAVPSRPAPQGRLQESGSPGARARRSPGRKRGQLNPEDRADGAPGPALSHPVHNSPGNKQEAVCFHLSSKNTRISSGCSGLPPKAPLNPRGAG